MFARVFHPSHRSYFLLGPRGTGKTTYLKLRYKKAVVYDLLEFSTYLRLLKDPLVFREEVSMLKKNQVIILDEVQRLPRLLDDVHHFLAQANNKKQFILSGSSARKLRKQSVNLLAGRASRKLFFPLVRAEYQNSFHEEDILKYGTLPETLKLKKNKDKIKFLESYVNTYLHEEIQQEAVTKNMESFSRFLDVAALCNGQVTNLSSLSRDAAVPRVTLKNYFQILEDTLMGEWLRTSRSRIRIKEAYSPKFYFFDTGVVRALSGRLRKELSGREKGFILETYLLHELKFWNQAHDWGTRIHFWRTYNHAEMDFMMEVHNKVVGIEVKASSRWKREFGKHLLKARADKTIHKAFGVYMGKQKLKQGDLKVYPLFDFLKLLEKNKLV